MRLYQVPAEAPRTYRLRNQKEMKQFVRTKFSKFPSGMRKDSPDSD